MRERCEGEYRWKASPATGMMELLRGTDIRLGLLTNGEQWMLVNAPKGESTSDMADVLQREKFYFRNYLDAEHFDLVVKANISKLRFMFLMRHLNTLLVSVIFVMAGNHAFT
jgi:hypothetical protein